MMRWHHASTTRRVLILAGSLACVLGIAAAPSAGDVADPGGAAIGSVDYTTAFDAARLSDKLPQPTIVVSAPHDVAASAPSSAEVKVEGAPAPGEVVVLETPLGDGWVPVSSARLDAHSSGSLPFTEGTDSSAFRVRISATTQHRAAASDVFAVAVSDASASPSPAGGQRPVEDTPPATPATPDPGTAEPSDPPLTPTDPATARATDPTPTDPVPASPSATAVPTQEPGTPAAPGPATPSLCGGEAPLRDDGRRWVCTYDDEFDGTSLDRRYWVPQQSNGSEFYTGTAAEPACELDDPRVIDQQGGVLNLKAVVLDEPVSCGSKSSRLASGSVMTYGTFSQTYGKVEVRAKLPDWPGKGYQETFWLWPNNPFTYGPRWPASGEIDFAEFYSTYPTLTIPVMHYLFDMSTVDYRTNTNIFTAYTCQIRPGEFNTYGLEWFPGLMKIFVNGTLCITNHYLANNAPADHPYAPFDAPFFLALSQAFGAEGNDFDPSSGPKVAGTTVDYVRVWQ